MSMTTTSIMLQQNKLFLQNLSLTEKSDLGVRKALKRFYF